MFQRANRSLNWQLRRVTSRFRVLPDFIGIGAQRSGTTSLFTFLADHPDVRPSFRKEVHFFDIHHHRGEAWYRANFALSAQKGAGVSAGEATPNYLAHPLVAQRAHDMVPRARLIALLRDPVERTFSSWKLNKRLGWETRSFSEAVEEEAGEGLEMDRPPSLPAAVPSAKPGALRWSYVLKSQYAGHLQRWLDVYPREQILVVQSEHLFESPEPNLKVICDFLEIDSSALDPFPRVNTTPSGDIDATTRRRLADLLRDSNQQLEELTGTRFDWA